jgi:hypothetical protein
VQHLLGLPPAEHDIQLREAEDEAFGLIDQGHLGVGATAGGHLRRQLEPAEPGTQHHHARHHGESVSPGRPSPAAFRVLRPWHERAGAGPSLMAGNRTIPDRRGLSRAVAGGRGPSRTIAERKVRGGLA